MSAEPIRSLRDFLSILSADRHLVRVEAEVDADLELAEIHRRVIAANGPALHFERVRGAKHSVVTNLFGSKARTERAFGARPREFVERVARLPEELMPPSLGALWRQRDLLPPALRLGYRRRRDAPVLQNSMRPPRLSELPILKSWEQDGGPFLTLPLVQTEPIDGHGAPNLGVYRMQRFDDQSFGMHWQIGKGGGYHFDVAERSGRNLPVTVFLGGPPALVLAAVAPLPENVPELLLASLLLGEKLDRCAVPDSPIPLVAEAEFALVGEVRAGERRPEGPFGDHYGYYSLQHDYPVFHCQTVYHRDDAILPATVVGKPRQEDFYIGDYLQELLSPIFPVVMPQVVDLWSYGETGYHSLAAAVVRERYPREAMAAAFRILGEGQLSLTKFLFVLDTPRDLKDFRATLVHALERVDFRTDLHLFGHLSMDTLDYNGPRVNEGSKGVLLALGDKKRDLPAEFVGELPGGVGRCVAYCPGCLVLDGPSIETDPGLAARLPREPIFADWPLLILVDDAERCVRTDARFLWTVFTRFEPAADMHGASVELARHHPSFTPPVLIDSRVRESFPDELFCDPKTAETVSRRWQEYFPDGDVEMGDSDVGHLDD